MEPTLIEDWVLVARDGEAVVLEKFEPCNMWTNSPIIQKQSLAELIDHCTDNLVHISDYKIQDIMDNSERRGDTIPPEVSVSFNRYLNKSEIENPSQAMIDKVMNRLGQS